MEKSLDGNNRDIWKVMIYGYNKNGKLRPDPFRGGRGWFYKEDIQNILEEKNAKFRLIEGEEKESLLNPT